MTKAVERPQDMVPLVGNGIDPNVAQPAAGPIDPRTGYPTYFTDGFTALELCLDATPPNDAAGNLTFTVRTMRRVG